MSRPGITKQEVHSAANQILGQGKAPTIELIRQILKTGSNSTIAVHLREWRASQSGTQTVALNEGLPHDIVAIVKGLWDRLSTQAGEKIDEVETCALQTITELQQDLHKYKTNNQRWQRLYNDWQQQKERLAAESLVMERTVESLQLRNKVLTEQLQEKRMRIEELHRLHAQAQENLEHLRRSHAEERLRDHQQFAQHKIETNIEMTDMKQHMRQVEEEARTLQLKYHTLQQAHAHIVGQNEQQQMKLTRLESQVSLLEKAQVESQLSSASWQQQSIELKQSLDGKIIQLIESQASAKSSADQLVEAKQRLKEMHDRNLLLQEEKIELNHKVNRLDKKSNAKLAEA